MSEGKILQAAELIDAGKYDEFQAMVDKEGFKIESELIDEVKTLSGIEYLEKEKLIPDGYFTEYDKRNDYPPLYKAYPEQIDFYIAHGADVNAEDQFGQTVLHHMVYSSRPAESIDKICKAGGSSDENLLGLLLERVTSDYDYQLIYYGEKSIERSLENIAVLLKNGYKPDYYNSYVPRDKKGNFLYDGKYDVVNENREFFDKILGNKKLTEQYPELIDKILSYEEKDYLQDKLNVLRKKLGDKVGKTADKTGKVTDEHREIAKQQVEISKALIKAKRERAGKGS